MDPRHASECARGAACPKAYHSDGHHIALTAPCGCKRMIMATAHKLLQAIHAVRKSRQPHVDPEADYEALLVKRNARRRIRMPKKHDEIEVPPNQRIRVKRHPAECGRRRTSHS